MLLGENSRKQNKIYSIMPLRKAKITHTHTYKDTQWLRIYIKHIRGGTIGGMKNGK